MTPVEAKELVRVRAYLLWHKAGRPEGRDKEFWFAAEKECFRAGDFDLVCGCTQHGLRLGHPDTVRWSNNFWHMECLVRQYGQNLVDQFVKPYIQKTTFPPLLSYQRQGHAMLNGRTELPIAVN